MWEVRDTSPETTNMVYAYPGICQLVVFNELIFAYYDYCMVGNLLSVFSICILQMGWNQKVLMQADWTHLRRLRVCVSNHYSCHDSVCFFAFSTLQHTI